MPFVLWVLMTLLFLIITVLLVLLLRMSSQLRTYEDSQRRLTPAYVTAVLGLTDAQATIKYVLTLVPPPPPEVVASTELDLAIEEAVAVTQPQPRFAPVIPLHPRSHS
jgi:hypothetical protein